jgi:hypothetical protein
MNFSHGRSIIRTGDGLTGIGTPKLSAYLHGIFNQWFSLIPEEEWAPFPRRVKRAHSRPMTILSASNHPLEHLREGLTKKSSLEGIITSAIFENKFKKAGESLSNVVYGRDQPFLWSRQRRGV